MNLFVIPEILVNANLDRISTWLRDETIRVCIRDNNEEKSQPPFPSSVGISFINEDLYAFLDNAASVFRHFTSLSLVIA